MHQVVLLHHLSIIIVITELFNIFRAIWILQNKYLGPLRFIKYIRKFTLTGLFYCLVRQPLMNIGKSCQCLVSKLFN